MTTQYYLPQKDINRVKRCVKFLKSIGEANSLTWQSICARPKTAGDFCDRVETEAAKRQAALAQELRQ